MGWYQGAGARLVRHVPNLAGTAQPACPTDATLRMVHCAWARSYTLNIPRTWTSGVYVCRLTRSDGFQSYIIFVVRNDASRSTFLFQTSVTTYQAYNVWGGRSLYEGPGRTAAQRYAYRSYAVSFDRPYDRNHGAGDFFNWEYPMLRWLERKGYDVTYSTDLDTDAAASRLVRHKAFLSVGHDEYWSEGMRDNVEAARQHGVSLGFFGANAAYWKVRLEPSSLGPRRVMVCYKDPAIDPGYRAHRADLATVEWRHALIGRPEQLLIGEMYESHFDPPDFPLRPVYTTAWPYAGTGLHDGTILPRIVGYEYDRVFPTVPTPPGLLILAVSPVVSVYGLRSVANVTLYTAPSGARVFAAGTIEWSWGLDDGTLDAGHPEEGPVHQVANAAVQRITANILDNFAR